MTALELDKQKKWMGCLGCGKKMWTDRCHRICRKCRRRNDATPPRRDELPAPRVQRAPRIRASSPEINGQELPLFGRPVIAAPGVRGPGRHRYLRR